MKLLWFERLVVNTPARAVFQRLVPTPFFLNHSKLPNKPCCLEVGCGQGAGVEIILKEFKASRVIGLDYDPAQVRLAKKRILPKYPSSTAFLTGDASSLSFTDAQFDAVFDFGILHHIPNWRRALAEIYRVLKPEGQFFYEDILQPLLDNFLFAAFFPHPHEAIFSRAEFEQTLTNVGFKICSSHLIANSYLRGVAQKLE